MPLDKTICGDGVVVDQTSLARSRIQGWSYSAIKVCVSHYNVPGAHLSSIVCKVPDQDQVDGIGDMKGTRISNPRWR